MDSDAGKITGVIEVDAAGRAGTAAWGLSSSAPHIRLRHAYGTIGNLLVGRTWGGLATDFSWFPTAIDAAGPYGASVVYSDPRMAQVRYTVPMGDNKLVVSAEENTGIDTNIAGDRPSMPRLVGSYSLMAGPAKVQIVLAMTSWQINETGKDVDDGYTAAKDLDSNGKDDDSLTWSGTAFGVNVAAAAGPGTVKFHYLSGVAGMQMNANIVNATAAITQGGNANGLKSVYTDSKGDLVAVTGTDMTLSYAMKLDDMSSINATYGSIAIGNDVDSTSADVCSICAISGGTSIHVNYNRNIAAGVNWGVEYATRSLNYTESFTAQEATATSVATETGTNSAIIFGMNVGF
jgi:hypothetical protein